MSTRDWETRRKLNALVAFAFPFCAVVNAGSKALSSSDVRLAIVPGRGDRSSTADLVSVSSSASASAPSPT